MEHITANEEYLVTQLRRNRTSESQRAPLDESGWPIDRTLCPFCHGEESGCTVCAGCGVVCPTCRGSRVLSSTQAQRPSIVGCYDCTDWPDKRMHEWDKGSWPVFARVYRREASAIQYYRSRQTAFDGMAAD